MLKIQHPKCASLHAGVVSVLVLLLTPNTETRVVRGGCNFCWVEPACLGSLYCSADGVLLLAFVLS